MATQMFVNLPVQNLNRSVEFFTKLGFAFNPKFTDENATCMIVAEGSSYVMLLVKPFFQTFIKKDVADAKRVTESIIALSSESRANVDTLVAKAIAAGGEETKEPSDHGWMYQRSFQDLDGHQWEILWMDPKAAQ